MNEDRDQPERFLSLVTELQAKDPRLTSLQAALIVAAEVGIALDSRSFARLLGVAHALVLRELNALVATGGPLRIVKREARTLRSFYVIERP
ncbi:hypothetical protein GCM10010924_19020 [Rhizobium wenxiniae]|uniref:Formate dehydrogenase F4B subunit n=1 Tax=Rhizobium wenxiniae TaxID=1737357 RepID=A0A7W9Y4L4_9HYPH|nr:hypothetical protein [Rhizobium wenxiniae]MBB6161752.1 hypothetical protein [Rhizobium wenxiniae]GGF91268.1 hypothetical protein GCM10010924_19020 [Rhizobium wenxiniae]